MGKITAPGEAAQVTEISVSAVVIRCGCGNPNSHRGQPCPQPRRFENKGELAYWHPSTMRRITRRLKRIFSHPDGE